MKLTYLSHSVFMIEDQDFKAVIDPFISGNPNCPIKVEELGDLTHIFVTHGHGDHLGDTVAIAKASKAKVITNFEIGNYLVSQGLENVHTMHIGGRTKMDFGRVKMTPALHGSGIFHEGIFISGGNPSGFVIEIGGKKVYHAGDTGLTMDMKLLEDEEIDVALLPIGGNFTMDIEDAVKAVTFIKPKLVIPMHYKTFDVIDADPEEFKRSVTDAEVQILNYGESIDV